jgi:uncharacterized caspase-like protein
LEQHRRVALVVGNSGGRAWGMLDTAGNDVALISNALLRRGFTPGSVALIYYAGHGVRSGGRNFLVLANLRSRRVKGRSGGGRRHALLRPMQQAHGALPIIVLDACRRRTRRRGP